MEGTRSAAAMALPPGKLSWLVSAIATREPVAGVIRVPGACSTGGEDAENAPTVNVRLPDNCSELPGAIVYTVANAGFSMRDKAAANAARETALTGFPMGPPNLVAMD